MYSIFWNVIAERVIPSRFELSLKQVQRVLATPSEFALIQTYRAVVVNSVSLSFELGNL